MKVDLFNVKGEFVGAIDFYFTSPPQYYLSRCTKKRVGFPTTLPPETDKVWTTTLKKTSGEIRLVVHCNIKEVLNLVLSDTTCNVDGWRTYWSSDVAKIQFNSYHDTASDFYRPGK